MNVWAWYALAGVLVALGAYLIGYAFKKGKRDHESMSLDWLEAQWRAEVSREPRGQILYDQDEPFRVPGTWPVICRECSAPLRLEEETPGAWFWRHKSRHLDLQHRADAVPVVTP
jgi:hypothetical protein